MPENQFSNKKPIEKLSAKQKFQEKHQDENASKKKPKSKKKIILFVLLVLIILGTAFWWLIWGRQASFLGDQVDFAITGTREIASGNKIDLVINYTNNERVTLENAEINILYPDGFVFENSSISPEGDSKNRFVIDKIASGESSKITISGRLLGNPQETKNFTATLSYKPENVSSRFSREAAYDILITQSKIQIEASLPKIVSEKELLKYQVKIKNTGSETIRNLQVKMDLPASFEINQVNPKSKEGNAWEINDIKPEKEEIIEVEGRLYGEAGETKIFKIQAGQKDEKGEFYLQNEKEIKVKIVQLDLKLEAKVNNQKEITAGLGEEVELKVHYQNKSSENLPDSKIEVGLDESLFDKTNIVVDGGRYEKGKLIWDKSTKVEFADLEKDGEGECKARLKIVSDIPVSSASSRNFSEKFKAVFSADLTKLGKEGKFLKESNEATIKINTAVGYNIEIRYFDENGKKVGAGPLPPKVGEETTYRVYLTLTNTTNDVTKAKAEVYLPEDISFAGTKAASAGNLDFFDGKIIWNLEKLEAGLGKLKPQLLAFFDISITPSASMAGKSAKLVEKSSFSGRDAFTDNYIKIERGILTTELERDLKAKEMDGKIIE